MANSVKQNPTSSKTTSPQGLSIAQSANRLRNYVAIERKRLRILAGWFLRIGNFESKYKLAYHLYDCSEHVSWLLERLAEMRGGNTNAGVRPALSQFLDTVLHAPSDEDFLAGFYGTVTRRLQSSVTSDLQRLDPSANANEIRLLNRIHENLTAELNWFETFQIDSAQSPWARHLQQLLASIGGLHGENEPEKAPPPFVGPQFERPQTIVFDKTVSKGELSRYEDRQQMNANDATVEQFKVFFNEFYAAALLASILFDANDNDYPWDFFADFSRHFWDEARHSEFGAIRLRELGVEPDRVNPVLFEEAEGLPVLHRVAYLTRGLEAFFMPRKPKRMIEYEESGDHRSQLFADQDWSDEINHVRYGSRWTNYLLEGDFRDVNDIIDEVKAHLSRVRGKEVTDIAAPF